MPNELGNDRAKYSSSDKFYMCMRKNVYYPVKEWGCAVDYIVRYVHVYRNKETGEYVVIPESEDKDGFEIITVFDDEKDNAFANRNKLSKDLTYSKNSIKKALQSENIDMESTTVHLPRLISHGRIER